MSKVLVTGGSGFVGSHTVLQLLEAGYEVRATVRNLAREMEVRQTLHTMNDRRLSFVAVDLAHRVISRDGPIPRVPRQLPP